MGRALGSSTLELHDATSGAQPRRTSSDSLFHECSSYQVSTERQSHTCVCRVAPSARWRSCHEGHATRLIIVGLCENKSSARKRVEFPRDAASVCYHQTAMSHSLPPLSSLSRIPQSSQKQRETYLPPLDMLTGYRRHQSILSSSPIRSSSPPRTPYLPAFGHYQPHIHSSPLLDGNVELPPLRYRADDPPSIWGRPGRKFDNHLPASLKQASIGRGRQSSYFDDDELPPSSEFEMGDLVEDAEMSTPELESETTGQSTPGHEVPSLSFSDSESEQHSNPSPTTTASPQAASGAAEDNEGDEEFGYGNGGWRATFFRVSEERGRWKDDPVALKPTTTAGLRRVRLSRQSMPARPSQAQAQAPSVDPSTTVTRMISEPLASTSASSGSLPGDDRRDLPSPDDAHTEECAGDTLAVPDVDVAPVEPEQDPETLPSASSQPNSRHQTPNHDISPSSGRPEHGDSEPTLTRDPAEEAEEVEEAELGTTVTENYGNGYSSPLPPSSPPLSPMSGVEELGIGCSFSRSSSPLSFLPSSPAMSESRDLDLDDVEANEEVAADEQVDEMSPILSRPSSSPAFSSALLAESISSTQLPTSDAPATTRDITVDMMAELSPETSYPSLPTQSRPTALYASGPAANVSAQPTASSSSLPPPSVTESVPDTLDRVPSTSVVKAKGKHVRRESQGSEKENANLKGKAKADDGLTKKRKGVTFADELAAPRPAKKRRADTTDREEEGKVKRTGKKTKGKGKERESLDNGDVEITGEDDEQESTSAPSRPKKKKTKTSEVEASTTTSNPRKPTTSSSRKRQAAADSTPITPLEPEPFDDELEGMLIEVLATSRASSLAVSVLCRSVLQAHPYLKDEPSSSSSLDETQEDSQGQSASGGEESKPCPYPYLKNRKSDKSWKGVVLRVLCAGTVEGGGSGVFGKVDSSGKDESDRPLDAQWFYVPESDKDLDRATLLKSLMPRPAKRTETKKYKQYYWRPLDKISRWDREDDL